MKIGVVVTAHEKYVKNGWFQNALDSVIHQTYTPYKCIVVLDKVRTHVEIPSEYIVLRVNNGNPNPGRNLACKHLGMCDWIIFLDADNAWDENYLEKLAAYAQKATDDIGIIYTNLDYYNSNMTKVIRSLNPPEYDYDLLREGNFIDTNSLWRESALRAVNYFETDLKCLDDWVVACKITKMWWKAQYASNAPSVKYREHGISRIHQTSHHNTLQSHYRALIYDVVSLISNKPCLADWIENLLLIKWPDNTRFNFYMDTNKQLPEIRRLLRKLSLKYPVILYQDNMSFLPISTELERHFKVAMLYNKILFYTTGDRIITIEDDVFPPIDVLSKLMEGMQLLTKTGVVSAVYPCRGNHKVATAAIDKTKWAKMPYIHILKPDIQEMGMVGLGCALWNGAVMRKCRPLLATPEDRLTGVDTYLCKKIRKMGYKIKLHGGVICEHRHG